MLEWYVTFQVYGSPFFWVLFAAIQISATLTISLQLYYMGRWNIGQENSPSLCCLYSYAEPFKIHDHILTAEDIVG